MDFDPRWNDDPRDRDDDGLRSEALAKEGRELSQGSRGVSSDPLERDARDPRDVFTRDLDLPRGSYRERVWLREYSVLLRGSESQALATTGAFRVVHADDLRDSRGQAYDPRSGELRHLREQKLVRTIPIRDGRALVVLTERGRDVLERNRHEREQHFYSGLQRPRELLHDAKVYQAYEREAERLREDGAVIHRVMLDTELKRALERIMLLDVILKEPDVVWLATPEEKMTHVSAFTAIPKDSLPQMATPQGSYEPVRYFPDQVPIGIHPDGRWILVCLLTQDAKRELRTFLERHLLFLAALPTWTLRVVIPAHMTAHAMRFVDEARRNLRWRFDGQFRDDLRWYFETRRTGGNPDAVSDDDERAHRARLRRFSGLGFSALYPHWVAKGDDVFPTVAAQVGDALFREAGVIEPLVLPHAYSHLAPLVGVA